MFGKLCPFCMRATEKDTCPHCGKPVDFAGDPGHLPVGSVLSGRHSYVLGAALGQGGFGITYIALDMDTCERVAIKEYFPSFCASRTNVSTVFPHRTQEDLFEKGKARFLDEAQLLKALSDLKGVVNVLDFFESNNSAYLVMEYLDGPSLKQYVHKYGKFPAKKFLEQMYPLMEDIEKVHRRGLIHRDIAPDNIILMPDGQLKLIDFGAARSFVGDKTMTVIVKQGFAPQEQYFSKGVTAATDIYALAATIYYCITGTVPTDSTVRVANNLSLPSPTSLGTELTPQQENALAKALEINQENRYQSVQAFLNALQMTPIIPLTNLDIYRDMTFSRANYPGGKTLSVHNGTKEISFIVPADIKDGQTIQLTNCGNYDFSSGSSGTLYITMHITDDISFSLKWLYIAIGVVAAVLIIFLFGPKESFPPPPTETQPTAHTHVWSNATCTSPQTCLNCGETQGSANGHSWMEATYDAPKTCRICGEITGSKLQIEPVYINTLSPYDKYGKIYYHDNRRANYDNNMDWQDLYTPGHIEGPVADAYGNTYTYGIHVDGDKKEPYYISYKIGEKYTTFSGWYGIPAFRAGTDEAKKSSKYFEVYCDGKLVFTSNVMKDGSMSQYFEIDITGVDLLTIQYAATNGSNDMAVIFNGRLS